MPTTAKAQEIDQLTEQLGRVRGAVLLTTQGLTVAEISEMRRKLAPQKIELRVVKNTLLRIATERAHYGDFSAVLHGQTSIAMGFDDEIAAAKAVADYLRTAKTSVPVTIKAGIFDKKPVSPAQVSELAKTPPMDVLRAMIVGSIQGPMSQTYWVISAPLHDLINVLEGRVRQMGGDSAAA